jgi:hypothetical protein
MSGFNFLSGSVDPNSLPALLRQRMAPGLIPGPVQPMPLTSGFRAPALLPGMGFMAMPQLPPVPGFKVQDGPGILSKLLSRFPLPTSGVDPNSGVIMNLADGLSGGGAPASGGAIDPLTGLLQDLGFGGGVETGGPAGAAAAGADAAAGGAAAGGAAAGGAAGAEAAGFSLADLLPFLLAA